uniref:Uncharacterized protein n=1 Tax=Lactuca sativa TaxID=4236 RepID=A0A9R1W151_LACSA|nr:hypothetical protein LSAT_V11C300102910 [Lactuca sativa]
MSPNGPRKVIIEDIKDEEQPQPVSLTLGPQLVESKVCKGELARYRSFTPKLSRYICWKPTQGSSSCSKKLCLDWVDKGGMGVVEEVEFLGADHKFHECNDIEEEVEDVEVIDNYEWDFVGEDSDNDKKIREIIK